MFSKKRRTMRSSSICCSIPFSLKLSETANEGCMYELRGTFHPGLENQYLQIGLQWFFQIQRTNHFSLKIHLFVYRLTASLVNQSLTFLTFDFPNLLHSQCFFQGKAYIQHSSMYNCNPRRTISLYS